MNTLVAELSFVVAAGLLFEANLGRSADIVAISIVALVAAAAACRRTYR